MRVTLENRIADLSARVVDLAEEMNAANNPDRLALRSLGVTNLGWTPKVYSEEAFRIWSREYAQDNQDLAALHHLAIMSHARAIDLEQSANPTSADSDWQAALEHWFKLWQADEFWHHLAEVAVRGGKQEPIDTLREQFPARYLQVHYDIATHSATSASRRNFHTQIALASAFPEASKTRVRTLSYERWAADIPDAIWRSAAPDATEAQRVGAIILGFLEIDPECIAALADALRIVVRVIRALATDLQALGDVDESQRQNILTSMRSMSEKWRLYFKFLAQPGQSIAEDVQRDFCLWSRVSGEVLDALGDKPGAMGYYELGSQVGERDEHERLNCARRLWQMQADNARDMVNAGDPQARSYCETLRQRPHMTILAGLLLANALQLLDDVNAAVEVCDFALAIEPEVADFDFMDEDENALSMVADLKSSMVSQQAYDLASTAFDQGEFGSVLQHIDQAIEARPSEAAFYTMRIRADLQLLDASAAESDVMRYQQLDGEADLDVLADLTTQIDTLRSDLKLHGAQALKLKRQAAVHFNSGDLPAAETALRSAITLTLDEGLRQLQQELAIVISSHAVGEANAHLDDVDVLESSLATLQEAVQLDPDNEQTRTNRDIVLEGVAIRRGDSAFEKAIDAWQAEDFVVAIQAVGETVVHQPERQDAYLLRARCYLAESELALCRADLATYQHLAAGDEQALEQVNIVQAQIDTHANDLVRYGPEVYALVASAERFRSRSQYADAVARLRSALLQCPPQIENDLKCQLSSILSVWGVEVANSAMDDLPALHEAEQCLTEAAELDPENTHAATNLPLITEAVANFLLNRFRNEAADEFKAERYPEALHLLEQALVLAQGDVEDVVKSELATVLSNYAVTSANKATHTYNLPEYESNIGPSTPGKDTSWLPSLRKGPFMTSKQLQEVLEASVKKLERARQLEPSNASHVENQEAIAGLLNQLLGG